MNKKVYIATKLYSFFDRKVSNIIYDTLVDNQLFSESDIYLPFKESNMKVSCEGNIANNIFQADILAMDKSHLLLTRLDGVSYDAGVGFEIGFFLASKKDVIIINTDFLSTKDNYDKEFKLSKIADYFINVRNYIYNNNDKLSYSEELDYNIDLFKNYICDIINTKLKENFIAERNDNESIYDLFIDLSGLKYEWSKVLLTKIKTIVIKKQLKIWISDRYSKSYDVKEDIEALMNSSKFLTCYDENEPDFDSCILQGIAFKNKIEIIGYESNPVKFFVKDKQEMGVSLMLEQSASCIVNKINDLETIL